MSARAAYPPLPCACKICGGAAPLEGVVDFNKNCEAVRGLRTGLSGIPVYYRCCSQCGFLFTSFCDGWAADDFVRHIYNADYGLVDTEYRDVRPRRLAAMVADQFASQAGRMRVLDFGGGNGMLAGLLRARGFNAASYDPFDPAGSDTADRLAGAYDLVTCFEVLEHTPDPLATARDIAARLAPGGLVLFSTLLLPEDRPPGSLDWWYIAPRNGHVSVFTARSLALLWRQSGLAVASLDPGTHLAWHMQDRRAAA